MALSTCFPAGTLVSVPASGWRETSTNNESSTKEIQKIKVGDLVESRNPSTGKNEVGPVIAAFKRIANETVTVTFKEAKSGRTVDKLTATPDHLFFVQGRGFVPLGKLPVGTLISTETGPPVAIASIVRREYPNGIQVYNFEVAEDHTYFAGKAFGGEWVHNSPGCGNPAGDVLLNAPRTGTAASKVDLFHDIPELVRQEAAVNGRHFNFPTDSGMGTITQMEGSINGTSGVYEYIVDGNGNLTHEFFAPGGAVCG